MALISASGTYAEIHVYADMEVTAEEYLVIFATRLIWDFKISQISCRIRFDGSRFMI